MMVLLTTAEMSRSQGRNLQVKGCALTDDETEVLQTTNATLNYPGDIFLNCKWEKYVSIVKYLIQSNQEMLLMCN